ncbi:FAD-dependent oxidoreductase [Kitasatospora sp. NPDC096147]|uniref:FAD-dependent oxidoreductase n=1 Tax=Kitasatospora sp. NPDC096147 TaxID=3364093 RepID=UPI003818D547
MPDHAHTPTPTPTPTHVTIIGAGLGGLTLARVLHVHGIPSTVYEAESSPTERAQGGLLDIHDYNGLLAVEAARLTAEFERIVLPGRQALRVLASDGSVLLDRPDDGTGGRPEVPRGELRRILLESLPAGTVRWGRKVAGVRPVGGGRHEVAFADGTAVTTSLLVGADGAWSRVRPLLSDAVPEYSGVSSVETYLYGADTRHPAAAAAVGGGSMIVQGRDTELFAHREEGGTLHAYALLTRGQDWFAAVDFTDPAAARARIAAEYRGWAPALTALLTDGDTAPVLRAHFGLPGDHRWARVPGVTLLGDAAHLQPPNGEGANLAMLDGADLGRALAAHPGRVEAALAAHERTMFARSAEIAALEHHDFQDDVQDREHGPAGEPQRVGGTAAGRRHRAVTVPPWDGPGRAGLSRRPAGRPACASPPPSRPVPCAADRSAACGS